MEIIKAIDRLFCIFFLLFFPKQITDVICYGRHRDKENIKSRRVYYFIYAFWFLFFGVFCLMIGSAVGFAKNNEEIKKTLFGDEEWETKSKEFEDNLVL